MNTLSKTLIVLCLLFQLVPQAGAYSDIYSTDPVTDAVSYLSDANIVEGYADGTFKPLSLINRAEFTKMIVEGVAGETPDEYIYQNCFNDVGNDWYAKYVCQAKEWGWVEGYAGDFFRPDDNVTRSEALKILVEALDWESEGSEENTFWDNTDSTQWFYNYILIAEEKNLFDTLDSFISSHEYLSRKQMSVLLYRALKYEEGDPVEVWTIEQGTDASYEDILATGLTAAYPSDMNFAHNSQSGWTYGCYSFAVKNLLEFKYDRHLDIAEVQKTIGWDGTFIWSSEETTSFAKNYNVDVIFNYNNSAEFFLKKLAMGEPLVTYIPYYIGSENIGHQVVAYSFDANGVWIADSLGRGSQRQIPFSDVFVDGAHTTTNLTELRWVKGEGKNLSQGSLK